MNLRLLIASSLFVVLPGCAVWDAYFMARYDNIEYELVNKMRTMSQLSMDSCKDQNESKYNFAALYYISVELQNFSQYVPRNEESYKLAGNLIELTKQGRELYEKNTNVSEGFCKLKLQQINRTAETAQKVIGSKPR